MRLHGVQSYVKLAGDVLVVLALHDQAHDLRLPLGQMVLGGISGQKRLNVSMGFDDASRLVHQSRAGGEASPAAAYREEGAHEHQRVLREIPRREVQKHERLQVVFRGNPEKDHGRVLGDDAERERDADDVDPFRAQHALPFQRILLLKVANGAEDKYEGDEYLASAVPAKTAPHRG